MKRRRTPWPCWLIGHHWIPVIRDGLMVGRVCDRRRCRGITSQAIAGGFAFDLEPEDA